MHSAGRWLVFIAVAALILVIGVLSSRDTSTDAPEVTTRASETSPATTSGPTSRTQKSDPLSARSTPAAKQPGRVRGFVRDVMGAPQAGVALALVGRSSEPIDAVKTQADGAFTLADAELTASAITLAGERRELAPLGSGEDRELVLIVGDTREVVGWVLDLAGDPLAGARVTLSSDTTAAKWSAWTDGNGGFRFDHAPPSPLRVVANALDLGVASARLSASDKKRREVTLVLEPSATLIVHGAPGITGQVLVRSWRAQAYGEVAPDEHGDDEQRFIATLGEALKTYDPDAPQESIRAVMLAMAAGSDEFASELRRNALADDPTLEGAPFASLVGPGIHHLLIEEPLIFDELRLASDAIKKGTDVMEALSLASKVRDDHPEVPPPTRVDPGEAARERLIAATGAPEVRTRREDRSIVERGVLDQEITLRGALEYDVAILHPSGVEVSCGTFTLDLGDAVEITCGKAMDGMVSGRVVDTRGRPISGLSVESYVDDKLATTETDEHGRFALRVALTVVTPLNVTIGGGAGWSTDPPSASRLHVAARPGGTVDVGLIVARQQAEQPVVYPTQPYGSVIEESTLYDDVQGFTFRSVDPMSPVGLEGVEDGATLLAVDDVDATHLALADVLLALRGDADTEVALRLRSAEGELYDVIVKRALVQTPPGLIGPQ